MDKINLQWRDLSIETYFFEHNKRISKILDITNLCHCSITSFATTEARKCRRNVEQNKTSLKVLQRGKAKSCTARLLENPFCELCGSRDDL
jgi:hypothetical protein